MEIPKIVKLLKTDLIANMVRIAYMEEKENLLEEFQDIDDEIMISHAKAYIVKAYEDIEDESEKERFIDVVQGTDIDDDLFFDITIFHELVYEYITSLNSLKSKIGDRVNRVIVEDIKELNDYKNTDIYKKLSKENNKIAEIIKDYHGYFTFNELKEKCHDEPLGGEYYKEYIISEEELKIIEATKNHPLPNQIVHLIYDVRKNYEYHCDHDIKDDKDILKKLLVTTNKNSPRYNIIFDDGTIICYNEGDIRVRPYTFKQVLKYTKLYFAKHYKQMLSVYENPTTAILYNVENKIDEFKSNPDLDAFKAKPNSDEIVRQMIINSFIHVNCMFIDYEEVYTKKMIDESRKELIKVKEITKKYDF